MLGQTFSFIKATGIGPIMATGIERKATMDHGGISEVQECPMNFEIFLPISVTQFDIINEFDMRSSRKIGGGGNARSTGTDAIIEIPPSDMKDTWYEEMSAMKGKGKAGQSNTERKENTITKTTFIKLISN